MVERSSFSIAYNTDTHASVRSHEISFTSVNKVIDMIDEMIATLKKEQGDDHSKKIHSEKSLDETDDTQKVFQLSISKSEESIEETEGPIEKQTEEIAVHTTEEEDSENLLKVDTAQPHWQMIIKERDHCAKIKEDCASAKYCKITGYKCIVEGKEKGKCSKYRRKRQAIHNF